MYTGLQHLHSYTAYLALAMLVAAILSNAISWSSNQPFSKGNRLTALLSLIFTHIQVVVGLVLYFISPLGLSNFSGDNMKSATARLYMLEHPLMMLIAVILITVGYSRAKRLTADNQKHKKIVIFYTIGLVLILSRIPWSAWF